MSRLPPVKRDEDEMVATFRRAAWRLRSGSGRAAADRAALDRAVGDLLDAVGTTLAADGTAVPDTVRRAALQVARQVDATPRRPVNGLGTHGVGRGVVRPGGSVHPARRKPVPFASSIKLGRMG